MSRVLLLVGCLLLALPARAQGVRVSVGGGMVSAGTVAGGFALTPSAAYSWRLSESVTASAAASADITGLTYGNPGISGHLTPTLAYDSATWGAGGGPSLVVLDTILCGERYNRDWKASTFCNRVVGVTPGVRLHAVHYWGGIGILAEGSVSYVVSGAVYQGPLFGVTIGPALRFGKKR